MIDTNTLLQDRYLVMHLLGQGGMGAVYKAIDKKFGNTVAVKETFYCDQRLREAFALEARLLNRLRHAALPVVTDYFSVESRQYLVMQYIPGRDMEQLLTERQSQNLGVFPVAAVMRWADQLLDALDYLHSQEPAIIHRDIKPQNLKLTPRGEVILLDFGLAKGATSLPADATRSIRGYTPNYSPFEQIRGTGTDARSDIYSVGATLYHLLAGEMPLDAASRTAAMVIGEPDPLALISLANPEVPAEIAAVIAKAMSLKPDQRYASAPLMRKALREAGRSLVTRVNSHRAPTLTEESVEQKPKDGTIVIQLAQSQRARAKASDPRASGKPPEWRQAPPARPQRRSRFRLSGGVIAAAVVFLAVFGFIFQGWGTEWAFARKYLPSDAQGAQTNVISGTAASLGSARVVESLRYYLEIGSENGELKREAGREPLASGSKFRFHFKPGQSGYLFVIASDKLAAATRVEAGADLHVPSDEQWFRVEGEKTPYTVIFSPRKVKTLDFLQAAAGRYLTDSERRNLELIRRDLSSVTPKIIAAQSGEEPALAVQLPEKYSDYQPVIFEIEIKKK